MKDGKYLLRGIKIAAGISALLTGNVCTGQFCWNLFLHLYTDTSLPEEDGMFVDEVTIEVIGGRGGNGAASFRREKYVPHGGPDGGDGGSGGPVVLVADESLNTLLDFKYRRHWKASNGAHGQGGNRHGRRGEDLLLPVPVGTVVKDEEGKIIADLSRPGMKKEVAAGGPGGKGNRRFASSRRQAPSFAEKGEPGEVRRLNLELKLMADIGLVGLPNAGKSTFLSVVSSAKPKIADYEFTTLHPQLGVVDHKENSFVVADLPGIIKGASQGAGLGYRFLRHCERTSILLHLIDVSPWAAVDPLEAFYGIDRELSEYSPELAQRPTVVVGNKVDLEGASANLERLQKELESYSKIVGPILGVSAVTGKGMQELLDCLVELLEEYPRDKFMKPEKDEGEKDRWKTVSEKDEVFVEKKEDYFIVKGKGIESLVARTDFHNEEAVQRFWNITRKMGLDEKLQEMGVQPGDTVVIGDQEFTFFEEKGNYSGQT